MPITVLQFDFYGLIFKKYNLVPRAHVSFDQHEDKELWNNRFLVQGFRTFSQRMRWRSPKDMWAL